MRELITKLNCRSPAPSAAIAAIEKVSGKTLPAEYVEFLRISDGGEGFVGNAYVILWSVGELASMNKGYQVDDYVAGLLIFGSNGGGEVFGFDTRDAEYRIVQVPFVGMDWSLAEPVASSFSGFLDCLSKIV